jgi:replicative DNA helicase
MSLALHPHAPGADKTPHLPANFEAEQALIGCVLYDNAAYERIGDHFRAEHFYEPFHQRLWASMERRLRKGELAEPILMAEALHSDPAFDELGGIRYLADLVDRAPPAVSAADYARAVYDLALRRSLITISEEIGAVARQADPELSGREQVEAAEGMLYELGETGAVSSGPRTFEHFLTSAIGMAAEAYGRDGGLSGISTGLIDLDQKTGGLHDTNLIILAARPSMGKSALAANIGFNVAKAYAWEQQPDGTHKTVRGGRVGFFSLEMSGEELALRIVAEVSGVPSERLRRGDVQQHEFSRVRDAAVEIQQAPLYIDDTGGLTMSRLAARARRMKRRHGLDLVIVDYLQLIVADRARPWREPRRGGQRDHPRR